MSTTPKARGDVAVELPLLVRVEGLAPATVAAGSTMFTRERVMTSLTKYGITDFSA